MDAWYRWRGIRVFIRTSYFYQVRFMGAHTSWVPVSICKWDPKWYTGLRYPPLVPRSYEPSLDCESCAKVHAEDPTYYNMECRYLRAYRKQLEVYSVERTLDDILLRADKRLHLDGIAHEAEGGSLEVTLVLLGFEVPAKLCSERFVVAEWMNKWAGNREFCTELEYPILPPGASI